MIDKQKNKSTKFMQEKNLCVLTSVTSIVYSLVNI